jgi:hypothetical protein
MNWGNLFSLRVWAAAFFVGFIGALLGLIWPPLGTVGFLLGFGWTMYFQVAHGAPVVCPHCHKRVKIGATTCRFCGKSTV